MRSWNAAPFTECSSLCLLRCIFWQLGVACGAKRRGGFGEGCRKGVARCACPGMRVCVWVSCITMKNEQTVEAVDMTIDSVMSPSEKNVARFDVVPPGAAPVRMHPIAI